MQAFIVLFALVAAVSAATLPESEKTFLKQVHETCQSNTDTHVDETLLKHMSQHSHDPKVMAHMMCMAQGTGMMTHNGKLDMSVIKNKMSMVMHDEHLVDNMMAKCAVQKDTPMKTAMDMWMCFMQNNIGYMHVL